VHKPPDEAAEVVTVQMADEDAIDSIGIETGPIHSDERRGSAIDQKSPMRRLDVIARLQSPAGSECISAADDRQTDCLLPHLAGCLTDIPIPAAQKGAEKSLRHIIPRLIVEVHCTPSFAQRLLAVRSTGAPLEARPADCERLDCFARFVERMGAAACGELVRH